jgi:hypothetical protein
MTLVGVEKRRPRKLHPRISKVYVLGQGEIGLHPQYVYVSFLRLHFVGVHGSKK